MMLEGAGYEVIDLGPDVPADKSIAAINEHRPSPVGLSALLTTTAPMMRTIVKAFQAAGVRDQVKVLVGGAAISEDFADEIGAGRGRGGEEGKGVAGRGGVVHGPRP